MHGQQLQAPDSGASRYLPALVQIGDHFSREVKRIARAIQRKATREVEQLSMARATARYAMSMHLPRLRRGRDPSVMVSELINRAGRDLAQLGLGIEFQRVLRDAILTELKRPQTPVRRSRARSR